MTSKQGNREEDETSSLVTADTDSKASNGEFPATGQREETPGNPNDDKDKPDCYVLAKLCKKRKRTPFIPDSTSPKWECTMTFVRKRFSAVYQIIPPAQD